MNTTSDNKNMINCTLDQKDTNNSSRIFNRKGKRRLICTRSLKQK